MELDIVDPLARSAKGSLHLECLKRTCTRAREPWDTSRRKLCEKHPYRAECHPWAIIRENLLVTYRLLGDVFGLNDTLLEAICEELDLRQLTIDEGGKVLVWTGKAQSNRISDVSSASDQPA